MWQRSQQLSDDIEMETKSEVDVGMFVAVTSGPPELGLVTEVLTDKALSLGRHIKETIATYIAGQARSLMQAYDEIDAIFGEKTKDPRRLMAVLDSMKGMDKRLKQLAREGTRLKGLFDVLWEAKHIFDDDDFHVLCKCFYNSATMRDKLQDASSHFRDAKWAVEEQLRKQRTDLQVRFGYILCSISHTNI